MFNEDKEFMKKAFRKKCLNKLRNSSKIGKRVKDRSIELKIKNLLKNLKLKNKNILVYMPLRLEPNISKLNAYLRQRGTVFIPFINKVSNNISFKVVKSRHPLLYRGDSFKIKESGDSFFKFTDFSIAVVPVLGVDGQFRRVGFGKGMYDKFFDNYKKKSKPIIIFTQIEKCFLRCDMCFKYDLQGDYLITPKEVLAAKEIGRKDVKLFTCRTNRDFSRVCNRSSSIKSCKF